MNCDTDTFGGIEHTRWTWSGCTAISHTSTSRQLARTRMSRSILSAMAPGSIRNRYFGTNTMW